MATALRKNNDKLNELLQKRMELLEKNPNLLRLQEKYTEEMEKAGKNPLNRCIVSQNLNESCQKLRGHVVELFDVDDLSEVKTSDLKLLN